jgi:hypothetical protein
MKKYLVISALLVTAFAQSETAEASHRRCFRQFLNATNYIIRCYDAPQQQSQWSLDTVRRDNLRCSTVSTRFGPRYYCY